MPGFMLPLAWSEWLKHFTAARAASLHFVTKLTLTNYKAKN
jgi:hypothetical protein